VPDDNSCLFSSIALIFEQDSRKAQKIRQGQPYDRIGLESTRLTDRRSHPSRCRWHPSRHGNLQRSYSGVIGITAYYSIDIELIRICSLSRDAYIATILKPATWGGAIELGILAKHYGTEIASIDVETGRFDRFEPPLEVSTGNR
jgi:ubiquitin thioesterase OTU1